MKKLYLIGLFLLPLLATAQEQYNPMDNCVIAEKVIAGSKGSTQSEASLTNNSDCTLMLKADGYEIMSFDLSLSVDNQFTTEHAKNNMFTPVMQSRCGRAAAGTKIFIENIVAKGPDGKVIKLKPVTVVM